MKICTKCGKENLDTSKFCQNCGTVLKGNNKKVLVFIFCLFLTVVIIIPAIQEVMRINNLYNEIIIDVDNKNWGSAKSKLDELGNFKDINKFSPEINYNYYLAEGDREFNNKSYRSAIEYYKTAKTYDDSNVNLKNKIANTEKEIKKLDEQERKVWQLAQKKKEQERRIAEANKPSVNKLTVLSKGFGYTQYGEKGVVGKIKNNNKREIWIRADIDLLDSAGNITGTTYTYQLVKPNEIWNFEAPTFGVYATNMKLNLSIDY